MGRAAARHDEYSYRSWCAHRGQASENQQWYQVLLNYVRHQYHDFGVKNPRVGCQNQDLDIQILDADVEITILGVQIKDLDVKIRI